MISCREYLLGVKDAVFQRKRALLQQHEITTSEKVFIFHGNFIQGIHVVEIDNTFQTSAVPPRTLHVTI